MTETEERRKKSFTRLFNVPFNSRVIHTLSYATSHVSQDNTSLGRRKGAVHYFGDVAPRAETKIRIHRAWTFDLPNLRMTGIPETTSTMFIVKPPSRNCSIWMQWVPNPIALGWCRHRQHKGKRGSASRLYQHPHRVRERVPRNSCA